jgi:hypothetical protein
VSSCGGRCWPPGDVAWHCWNGPGRTGPAGPAGRDGRGEGTRSRPGARRDTARELTRRLPAGPGGGTVAPSVRACVRGEDDGSSRRLQLAPEIIRDPGRPAAAPGHGHACPHTHTCKAATLVGASLLPVNAGCAPQGAVLLLLVGTGSPRYSVSP